MMPVSFMPEHRKLSGIFHRAERSIYYGTWRRHKKLLLAGIGTAAVTAEKSKEVLDELVKKGELTVEQGKVLNQELKHNIKESVKKNVNVTLKPSNPDELKDVLNKMTPDQLAALKEQISQMQAKDVDAEGAKEEPEEAKEAEAEEAPAEEPEEN